MLHFCKNVYVITGTRSFPQHLANLPSLQNDKEDASQDFESLVAKMPVLQTIDYITELIYVHNKIKHICIRLVDKRLRMKLATEYKFKFVGKPCDCIAGGPSFVSLRHI